MTERQADLAAAFRDGAVFVDNDGRRLKVERIEIGRLAINSGSVALGDPRAAMGPVTPPQGSVPSGRYGVELSVVEYPDGSRYVAAARIIFRDERASSWTKSEFVVAVEGEAGFADGSYEAGGMIREIGRALRESYENAFSHALVTGAQGEVAAFSAGTGGGEYAAFWGVNAGGEPVQLCVDFAVLTERRTEDIELVLPLPRGKVLSPLLERYGAHASVPLLAPETLKVTFRAPYTVAARWKGGGLLQMVPMRANAEDGVTFDLSAPPADSTLLLCVAVGWQQLREIRVD